MNPHLAPRTIEEWLHLIPFEPARQQALDAFKEQGYPNKKVDSLFRALYRSFTWNITNEGFVYWTRIYISITHSYGSIKIKTPQEPPTMGMGY